jgi:hypothetical protein
MKITISINGENLAVGQAISAPKLSSETRDTILKVQETILAYLEAGDKTSKTLREARLQALMRQLDRLLAGSENERLGDVPVVGGSNPTYTPKKQPGLAPHNIHD